MQQVVQESTEVCTRSNAEKRASIKRQNRCTKQKQTNKIVLPDDCEYTPSRKVHHDNDIAQQCQLLEFFDNKQCRHLQAKTKKMSKQMKKR